MNRFLTVVRIRKTLLLYSIKMEYNGQIEVYVPIHKRQSFSIKRNINFVIRN